MEALRAGEVIGVPTDTVYSLAVIPGIVGAVERLFTAKGRPGNVPIAVLVSSPEAAAELAAAPLPRALVERHWPGALTLVVRRRPGLDWNLGGDPETIGVRCPDHELIRTLCAAVGPLATTSANRHGEPTAAAAAGVAGALDAAHVSLVLDGGECPGTPSTVVDLTGEVPVVLREGAVGEDDLLV